MCVHILQLDFKSAFYDNPLAFFMVPFLLILLIIKIIFMPEWLKNDSRIFNFIMIFCLICTIVFGIIRNI